ncbi:MAG: tRNA pseudouridine(38-40) synthase TruA [Acidobacteria bacterium RIFCSPLOWO2_12_FULL_59_11]|nr:MAG: tRNA pseudouridine(38-40) synthase TruA [Acidobacteria bacterium RIFCSPLOWO2_12_FULL_59_11]
MNEPGARAPLRNLLLRVAYDGTDFYGWQIQPRRPTIQGTLTTAIEEVSGEQVQVCGAGRTDAGVHACAQAANVKLASRIPCSNFVQAVNDHLPESIRVLSVQEVPLDFHARHHAQSKTYCYRIFREKICPPWLSRYVFPLPYPLQEEAMQEAARHYQGTWDFRSFASTDRSQHPRQKSEDKSYVRTILSSVLERRGEELVYTVEGSGFLHHMVRNLVGTLILAGRKQLPPEAIPEILAARQRSAAGPTVPARGLHLVRVSYPGHPDS